MIGGVAVVCVLVVASCGTDETVMGPPGCRDDLILVAQSVPGAAFVPCFEELPGGWSVSQLSISQGGMTMKLDSDRAGSNAATFVYLDSCDVSGVGRLASEQEGVRVHEEIGRLAGGLESHRLYVFDGGCVTVQFDFDAFDDITHAESLLDSMLLARRGELNESLREQDGDFIV